MVSSGQFCLKWNDFESNISSAFRELRDEKDLFDVTLACEDSQVQAHKVILSACSPFFRNILRRNPHQHPLLYLKGVKYRDLLSLLDFMYMGEVSVAQEELNGFLAVAGDLRVKGLVQNSPSAPGEKKLRPIAPKLVSHSTPQIQPFIKMEEDTEEESYDYKHFGEDGSDDLSTYFVDSVSGDGNVESSKSSMSSSLSGSPMKPRRSRTTYDQRDKEIFLDIVHNAEGGRLGEIITQTDNPVSNQERHEVWVKVSEKFSKALGKNIPPRGCKNYWARLKQKMEPTS